MKEQTQSSELKTQSFQSKAKTKEVAAGFSLRNQENERNLKVAATILSHLLTPFRDFASQFIIPFRVFVLSCFRGFFGLVPIGSAHAERCVLL